MPSGGARKGCGRKSASLDQKRVQVSLSVSPETKRMLDELRGKKVKVGQVIDSLIEQYCADNK